MAQETLGNYLRDLVYLLRERGADAEREKQRTGSEFHEGREMAYREMLAWMQHQADAFAIDRKELCLDGFDALTGNVDPEVEKR